MTDIKEYIQDKRDKGFLLRDVAKRLNITVAMVCNYSRMSYYPSLPVAKRVYELERIVLHPYAEESLIKEIEKDKR